MKILLDSDVLLDVLLDRAAHSEASLAILDWAELNPGKCSMAWHTVSNLAYLGKGRVRQFLSEILVFIEIPATGGHYLQEALKYPMSDLEDAMQVAAASAAGAQIIVTRNTRDYRKSPVQAMVPEELLKLLVP